MCDNGWNINPHFTPKSNQQSTEWTAAGESCLKWPKTQISAGKVLASLFWDVQGILFLDYFEKGRTINSEYYIASLVRLKEEITKKKRSQMKKTNVLFHQDCQLQRWQKLHELQFELFPHLPHSPYLAPSDYWLFVDHKRMLQGKRFGSNEEVMLETEVYFEVEEKSFNKKRLWIVREVLESMYHTRRRLCWWILPKSYCFIS